jgi:hypothetical protein
MVLIGGFRETGLGTVIPHAVSFLVCVLVMWLSKQASWTALVPTADPREPCSRR